MRAEQLVSVKEWVFVFISGFLMGSADLVPGISGGTMAFILGIYERLIAAITSINAKTLQLALSMRFRQLLQAVPWTFAVALVSGILAALVCIAPLIESILNDVLSRQYLYSVFIGLVIASALYCAKWIVPWKGRHFAALLIGMIAAYLLTGLNPIADHSDGEFHVRLDIPSIDSDLRLVNYQSKNKMLTGIDQETLNVLFEKQLINENTPVYSTTEQRMGTASDFLSDLFAVKWNFYFVLCGCLAVSAMLLPGISGSYILVILGVYPIVIGAVSDLSRSLFSLSIDGDAALLLAQLLLGVVIGAIFFSRLLSYLLAHYHQTTLALLVGFMLGALRAVWPFWRYVYAIHPLKPSAAPALIPVEPVLPDINSSFWASIIAAALAFFAVFFLEFFAQHKKGRQ